MESKCLIWGMAVPHAWKVEVERVLVVLEGIILREKVSMPLLLTCMIHCTNFVKLNIL